MSLKPKLPKPRKGNQKKIDYAKYRSRQGETAEKYLLDFTQRNAVSRKVLKEMKVLMKQITHDTKLSPSGYLTLEYFTNGRERGYTMQLGNRTVHWAEYRNTDDIVVYESKGKFDKYSYDNRLFFRPNETRDAAEFMLKYLYNDERLFGD